MFDDYNIRVRRTINNNYEECLVVETAKEYVRNTREFEHIGDKDIGPTMFNFVVHQAVKNLFGEIGESCVDVIKYDPLFSEAIIVTNESFRGQLHSALMLFGCYDNKRCAFRVMQISSSLINLASDSRQLSGPMKSNI